MRWCGKCRWKLLRDTGNCSLSTGVSLSPSPVLLVACCCNLTPARQQLKRYSPGTGTETASASTMDDTLPPQSHLNNPRQPTRLDVAGRKKHLTASEKSRPLVTQQCPVLDDDVEPELENKIDSDSRKCLLNRDLRGLHSPTASQQEGPDRSLAARMSSSLKTFLACSLLAFVSVQAAQRSHVRDTAVRQTASLPVVTVTNGSYEGLHSTDYDQDYFLGMRYAQVGKPFSACYTYSFVPFSHAYAYARYHDQTISHSQPLSPQNASSPPGR